ncbi:MAG: hypothetical protein LUG66_05780 [Clostridiales bacterium]|nr:hypothetical protein [Clostridiales bacterium]
MNNKISRPSENVVEELLQNYVVKKIENKITENNKNNTVKLDSIEKTAADIKRNLNNIGTIREAVNNINEKINSVNIYDEDEDEDYDSDLSIYGNIKNSFDNLKAGHDQIADDLNTMKFNVAQISDIKKDSGFLRKEQTEIKTILNKKTANKDDVKNVRSDVQGVSRRLDSLETNVKSSIKTAADNLKKGQERIIDDLAKTATKDDAEKIKKDILDDSASKFNLSQKKFDIILGDAADKFKLSQGKFGIIENAVSDINIKIDEKFNLIKSDINKYSKGSQTDLETAKKSVLKAVSSSENTVINTLKNELSYYTEQINSREKESFEALNSGINEVIQNNEQVKILSEISDNKQAVYDIDALCKDIYTYAQKREEANQLIIKKQQKMMYFIISINVLMFLGVLISMVCLLF